MPTPPPPSDQPTAASVLRRGPAAVVAVLLGLSLGLGPQAIASADAAPSISGTIVDGAGHPLAGARLRATGQSGYTDVGADGSFTAPSPNGDIHLEVDCFDACADGYRIFANGETFTVDGPTDIGEVRFPTVAAAGTVLVTDADGVPLQGAHIEDPNWYHHLYPWNGDWDETDIPLFGGTLIQSLDFGVVTDTGSSGTAVLKAPTGHTLPASRVTYTYPGTSSTVVTSTSAGSPADDGTLVVALPAAAPGAPTAVTALAGAGSATVSWAAAAAHGSPVTGYTVTASPGGATTTTDGGTSATLTDLTAGTAYTFTVTATNAQGTGPASAASSAVTAQGPPGAPTLSTATARNSSAVIGWTAPDADGGSTVTGYVVDTYVGETRLTSTSATAAARSVTVPGLTNGTAYRFTVTAANAHGAGTASVLSEAVVPAAVPGAPALGTVTAGNGSALVRWTAPAATPGAPLTGYTVRVYAGRHLVTTRTTPATARSLTVPGLTNRTAYTFTVLATNRMGTSPASAHSATATPAAVPGAPELGTVTAGHGKVVVTWTAPASNGGAGITGYTVTVYAGDKLVRTRTVGATARSATIGDLTNGKAYRFTVTAANPIGAGRASARSAAVTPVPAKPGAPTPLAPVAGKGAVTARWTAPTSDGGGTITGYTVATYRDGVLLTSTTVSGKARSLVVRSLSAGHRYSFVVTARNTAGAGKASARSASVRL